MRLYTERGRVRIPLSDSYFAEPLAAALSGKQGGGEEAELEHTARPSPCLRSPHAPGRDQVELEVWGILKRGRTQLRVRLPTGGGLSLSTAASHLCAVDQVRVPSSDAPSTPSANGAASAQGPAGGELLNSSARGFDGSGSAPATPAGSLPTRSPLSASRAASGGPGSAVDVAAARRGAEGGRCCGRLVTGPKV